MTPTTAAEIRDLKQAWARLRTEQPNLRIRNAAEKLGVSEAELLATEIGETVTLLEPKFPQILREFHRVGRIMALTRNEAIVHERKGEYKNVEVVKGHRQMGLAVNEDIDLRIFFDQWRFGFAVTNESESRTMRSFQFFDAAGTAIHKVYLQDETFLGEYDQIVREYSASDQNHALAIEPKAEKAAETPDAEINISEFRHAWAELRDTHDFFPMLRNFGVAREQALRLADPEMAREVNLDAYKFMLEEASSRELPIMVFVGNPGIIQIHTGRVERIAEARGWFNVLDEAFNLHIDQDQIARVWVVKKPTTDGIVTSLELFNESGENVALFFGKRKPGIPESEEWRALVKDLPA
jgi:putative hemin transport protein